MLVQLGASKRKTTGQCVGNWYFSDKRAERNALILASMKKYSDSYPSAVMLALVERECGSIRN